MGFYKTVISDSNYRASLIFIIFSITRSGFLLKTENKKYKKIINIFVYLITENDQPAIIFESF